MIKQYLLTFLFRKNNKLTTKNLIKVNLQLFADSGEKTEKGSPKKRQKSREKGQVRQSKELTSAVSLISMFLTLKIFGEYFLNKLKGLFSKVFESYIDRDTLFTVPEIVYLFIEIAMEFILIMAPIFIVAILVGVTMQLSQVGFLFTLHTIKPKFSKINPLSGFKKIFSMQTLVELIKSILKIVIISYIGYSYIAKQADQIPILMEVDVITSALRVTSIAMGVAIRMSIAIVIIGLIDFVYQWWQFEKNLKMSKQEVKEEHKQQEGNPEIKSKIKQRQREMSMRRMMQDVPQADVIITNPTHFSVAIKYDAKKAAVPYVVAKGIDYVALRIREVAKENNVYIMENRLLARSLHASVEIGDTIPEDLYQAVAEVLAFVYSLKEDKNIG